MGRWRASSSRATRRLTVEVGTRSCLAAAVKLPASTTLAKTRTSVAAKPIAATMTRTASTAGYELGLLAAAGCLTIIPGAFVIYFVRHYIAKGFALGRV